jgi:hypothetical protein
MRGINERYLAIQQNVLEIYIDRGQLARLSQPTITASGRPNPRLKLDNPRLLAVNPGAHVFRASRPRRPLSNPHQRAKGLVLKVPKTQTTASRRRGPPSFNTRNWGTGRPVATLVRITSG